MNPELLEILNEFHTELDECEIELPNEIFTILGMLSAFLDQYDPVPPE